MTGEFKFISPYWDKISWQAKVGGSDCFYQIKYVSRGLNGAYSDLISDQYFVGAARAE